MPTRRVLSSSATFHEIHCKVVGEKNSIYTSLSKHDVKSLVVRFSRLGISSTSDNKIETSYFLVSYSENSGKIME